MSGETTVLFSCGDRSAENHLIAVLDELRTAFPRVRTFVLGGERCRTRCDVFVEDLVGYDAHGFFAPFRLAPRFVALLRRVERLLRAERVRTVVLLDYYGFNVRLAERARRLGIRTVYYIPPQVWASRAGRLHRLRRCVDLVIPVYPFEPALYRRAGIPVQYFGHPVADMIGEPVSDAVRDRTLVGLFPGSRGQVISWNLPVMLRIARRWAQRGGAPHLVLFGFERYRRVYERWIARAPDVRVSVVYDGAARSRIGAALSVSGTVTLENALEGIPMVVLYRLPELMYRFLKAVVRVRSIALPNIILDQPAFPEFVQHDIRPDRVIDALVGLLTNAETRTRALAACAEVRRRVCGESVVGGRGRVARAVAALVAEEGSHA